MNKIFKVIWSKSRNCYVVASELAKGTSKSTSTGRLAKRAALAAVAALLISPLGAGYVSAADYVTVKDTNGTSQTVYTKDGVDVQLSEYAKNTTVSKNTSDISDLEAKTEAITYDKDSNTVMVDGKLTAAEGITDGTTTQDGQYVNADNYVGQNLNALDTQVKANADAIAKKANAANVYTKAETDQKVNAANTYTYRKVAAEEKAREAADNELNERITNEANAIHDTTNQLQSDLTTETDERKAADTALDTRITNVKEYLENQTADKYVSKDDAAVQDGAIVKAANTIGDNVTKLDAALAKETADRLGADAAQDKVIKQVNDNLVASVNTINESVKTTNENMAAGFTALSQADANEAATREAKYNELNERITNEANAIHDTTNQLQSDLTTETDERKAADTALDTRITNVKEYLENQTADKYVSKDDAAVQDGAIVKAANTIGDNVTKLDAALAKETADRLGADAAQDKVIQQVNDNLVASVNTINTNMAAGFNALSQVDANEAAARQAADTTLQTNIDNEAAERKAADTVLDDKITAETSARVEADTKLVEAVNSGVSLSNDNVLQKNTTTIDAQGNVTTSKTDANEMILNKGKDNQITLNEKGIKVGTNSSVMDKDGVYTGGNTYSEAKAAMSADGSIKGADGKFTVNSANGTVNVNDQIELNGATGVVKSNGLNVGDGNMTVSNNGNINTVGTLSVADGKFKVNGNGGVSAAGGKTTLASDGSIKAADGKFTVNSNGGVKAADGKITLSSDGSVKAADGKFTVNSNGAVNAADGKFTVDSNGAVKAANGNTTIDSNGNLKTAGTLSAADGSFKVDSNGKITSTGLDAGNGTIQTTGTVQAGDVKTGTLETTGDATIGGNLTVDKNLTVNGEFNAKTLSSKLDENNYTTINGGKTQSVNLKMDTATGETKASASTFDETGSNTWARDDDSIGKSTVTADGISQKLSNTGDNPTAYAESAMSQGTDNKYTMTDTVKDGDKTNVASQSATDSSNVITDENKNTSTFRQKVDSILQEINNADNTNFSSVEQKLDSINSKVTDGTNTTSVEQGTTDITNKAEQGTITNSAKDLVNTATGDMTNTVGGKMLNDVTGDMENKVGGEMKTTVTGKVTEDYKSDLDTKVGGNEIHAVTGNQTVTVSKDRTVNVKGTETENFNAQVTNVKTDQRTSVGGNQTNIVAGNQQNTVSGSKTETVKGSVTEKYGNQATTVDGDQSTHVGGNQSNVVAGDQTNTISGSKTESVKGAVSETYGSQTTKVNGDQSTTVTGKQTNSITGDQVNTIGGNQTTTVTGDVTEDYKANLSTMVGGNQTTTVTGDSSLTAENITNEAKNKITNKAIDVETDASSSIVNKVSNDAGSNTSTQLSYQTKEEMSQADGKTASYLRGAAEEKSQLTDGDKKTTIDTIAGQTNTNITDGTNTSNSLQKADQVASSVTDGTNTTVVDQKAGSLASSITDGTKANNTNNTVDKSEQLIKASDTQYSATIKTATKMEDALVSGSSIIDVIKSLDDAGSPTISSAVTDGTNTTGVIQTAKDITNTAKNGTIANDAQNITNKASETLSNNAKNITNTATEKLSNSAADIENKASNSILNQVGDNTSWKMTDGQVVESIKGTDGQTNTTTTTSDNTYQSVQNGNNVLAKRTSSTNDNLNITDGTNTYSKITTATSNKQTVTDGTETASTNLTKSASNTYITNGTQTVTNHIAADTTNTVMNEGSNGSRQEQTASQILNRVTDGTDTSEVKQTASEVATSAKDITNTASEKITNQIGDGSAVKSEMTADGITNTATKITNITGDTTVTSDTNGTTFENTAHSTALTEMTKHESGDFTTTTISGNTLTTGQATMDYAEVMKDLGVHGNATVDGDTSVGGNLSVTGTSTLTGDVTMKSNATVEKDLTVKGTTTTDKLVVNNGATVTGGTTTDTLNVTGESTFGGKATFKDIVTMEKDLSVDGNATVVGSMTASSYKVGDKTYIDSNGINANNQKVVNVAPGRIAADSTDAVNGSQLYQTNERVTGVENKVNKLDSRVDKVGANAAALANLHPLEFDADSKWNIAAAVGGYKGETATAIGAFYRPNENVMINVSSSFGTGENMYGGGISLRIGQGGNKARRNATNGLTEREKVMQQQINSLTNRLDALLSVINPNMSKEFPDVPENHWAYEAVSRLAGNGVIQGYEDGKYHGERTMTRYEMAEIIYNALSKGAKAEKKLVEEFKPELQAMAAQKKA